MKVILVTGANKGIGQAIVKRLLAEFPDTHLLLGSRDKQRGDTAVQELLTDLGSAVKPRLEMLQLDVGDDQSVAAAVAFVKEKFGSLYGLVNNAGGWLSTDRDTIQLNAFSVVRVCEAFAPLLETNGSFTFIIYLGLTCNPRSDSPDILSLGTELCGEMLRRSSEDAGQGGRHLYGGRVQGYQTLPQHQGR